MTNNVAAYEDEIKTLTGLLDTALTPGGSTADMVAVVLTKRQVAILLASIDMALTSDPLTEDPDVTRGRATDSLVRSLEAFDVSPDDKAALLRMITRPWQYWCAAMQKERLAGTDAYRVRAAALGLIVNVFWETICMTAAPERWTPIGEKLLAQVTAAIRQGPGR